MSLFSIHCILLVSCRKEPLTMLFEKKDNIIEPQHKISNNVVFDIIIIYLVL